MKRDPKTVIVDDDRDLAIDIRSEFRMMAMKPQSSFS
jgi:hypothetical protein